MQAEPFHRLFHDVRQFAAVIRLLRRHRIALRHRHPGLARQNLHRFHEADIVGFLDEGDGIALGMAAKAIIVALAIIDMERGGVFLMERARCPQIAAALIGLAQIPHDLAAHHLAQRGAGAKFVEESGWQVHRPYIGAAGVVGKH